jgi:hypothetical protein
MKNALPKLENFQIKYVFEAFEMRNNFTYSNFSKFRLEFELEFKEALGFKIQYNLIEFVWTFKNWWDLNRELLLALGW